ncbi:MAG: AAA family ATPase, partial [Solirubrobacteraceae bacterium]
MNQSALVLPDVLLEREHEVEHVCTALRGVGQRAGMTLVIEGEAGMGKSRLLEVARQQASEDGFRVLSARATELEQGFPFGVARQLFERAIVEASPVERGRWLAGAAALAADVLTASPTPSANSRASAPPAGDSGYAA